MKNWLANKIEDLLDAIGSHAKADMWFRFTGDRRWYQQKYRY